MDSAHHIRVGVPTALLTALALAACGGGGSGARPPASGASSGSTPVEGTGSGGAAGSLEITPRRPTTSSELSVTFTAPLASGVHGTHVISYTLSLVGPQHAGCVATHEAASPAVGRGARSRIVLGPSELHAPWCAGSYIARVLELRSAHCTGTTPCPQYVAVAGIVGRRMFTIRRG
jgi:hypothetical protein